MGPAQLMTLQPCLAIVLVFGLKVSVVNSNAKHLHGMIHRHALASKALPPELKEVLDDVVSMVNAIKSSTLNTRLFRLLCQELDENHEGLLFHTEVRWLSREMCFPELYRSMRSIRPVSYTHLTLPTTPYV